MVDSTQVHDAAAGAAASGSPGAGATASAPGATQLLLQLNADALLLRLLSAVAEHGIADRLAAGPRTAQELAAAESLDAAALYRVLRYLASRGFFREDDAGRFQLEALGQALRSGVEGSVRDRLRLPWQDLLWRTYERLPDVLTRGGNAFELAHGRTLFDYLADHPDINSIFDRSMARLSQLENPVIAAHYPFEAATTVVDVAGGRGGLLAAVLERHAHVRGVLFDQAQVITAPDPVLAEPRFAGRWQAVGGDFFEAVPPGGDLYLLKRILHDWDDARAAAILRRCHAALGARARLLIIDAVIEPGNAPDPNKFTDVNMLALTPGRERSAREFDELCASAGLAIASVRRLPAPATLSIVEARRA